MKTFKLKALKIIENQADVLNETDIGLIDGLIINKEDEKQTWVVEGYIDKSYWPYFTDLQQRRKQILIQAKITSETNEPAVLITSIIDLNELGREMNVVFMGNIVDHRKHQVEKQLKELIDQGFHGEELLEKFKSSL